MTNIPPETPSSQKSSVIKWVAIGCGGLLVLGIGLFAGLAFWGWKSLNPVTDPQQVEAQAKSLFDYNIPGGSKGLVSMNIMGVQMSQIVDTAPNPNVFLMVGVLPAQFASQKEAFQQSFQESMQQQLQQNTQFSQTKTEQKTLCNQEVPVLIQEGQGSSDNQSAPVPSITYNAFVNYQGSERFIWLMTSGDQAKETAEAVFNSLKCK
jgi:hypothetical protein